MLKHERYLANKEELKAVLDGKQKFTLILEPIKK